MDVETESKLIGQEHRFWRIVYNFITRKERFPDPEDPRRAACVSAFCWNLFFSPSTVATTGGFVAAFTLMLLWWQNQLLQENNTLVATSINPEQRYVVSVKDELRILRTVTERNNETIKNFPLGVGSVLFLDLNVSCSGSSPLVIEQIQLSMKFRDGDKSHTVQFVATPLEAYRQVVRPSEIALIDARIIPAIRSDDEIHRWTYDKLSSGELFLLISGRDVKGIEWRIEEQRMFSRELFRSRGSYEISNTEDFLPPRNVDVPESVSRGMDLPVGNPNRILGTFPLAYGIKTEHNEHRRLVLRMARQAQ